MNEIFMTQVCKMQRYVINIIQLIAEFVCVQLSKDTKLLKYIILRWHGVAW